MSDSFAPNKRNADFLIVRRFRDGKPSRAYRAKRINIKPKLLCKECNNVKLGYVEDRFFKPLVEPMMLKGRNVTFNEENILTLAVWAFKTLLVSNHTYYNPPFFYSLEDSKRFMKSMIPPEQNLRIWLFRFRSNGPEGHICPLDLFPTATIPASLKHLRQYALTFIAGRFGFQIHAISGEDRDLTGLLPPPSVWDAQTVQMWPCNTNNLCWPPPKDLRSSQYDSFSTRFGGTPPPDAF